MIKKIVIWGHPEYSNTFAFIHYGLYKACKFLEYDVEWVPDSPENKDIDLTDAIVFSEHQQIKHLPYNQTAKYFIHNLKSDFQSTDKDNFYNYLVYHENYKNWEGVKKIDNHFWFCEKTKTPVIMWATDILPDEIDRLDPCIFDESKSDVNFIGSIGSGSNRGENIIKFAHVCADNGKNFVNYGGLTGYSDGNNPFYAYDKNIEFMRNSYIGFDIREKNNLANGYVPCRIFKNMSYGKWVGTNSLKVNNFFEGRITVNDNLESLYKDIVSDYKKASYDDLRDNMNYIRDNHTYVTRIKSFLSIL